MTCAGNDVCEWLILAAASAGLLSGWLIWGLPRLRGGR